MSSYFDALQRQLTEAREVESDPKWLDRVTVIDHRLFMDVTAVTGDREFPDDLREKMLGALALYGVWQPTLTIAATRNAEYALAVGYSRAVEELHSLFHELASRRVTTRFGLLGDSPTQIAVLRDEYEKGR